MTEFKIVKTVELSGMPNPALAKDLLERLRLATAKVVENRKWRVPVLKEFYPQNRSLLGLNVNRGKSIMIRLREGHDQMTFLPWESVLGTLVHELTHNEIGEHSAAFYSMMEKVYDEVDATSSSGGCLWGPKVASTPKYQFDGKSSKVGGGSLAKKAGIAKDDVRQLAAEAALRRMGQQSNSNGQAVGGKQPVSTKTRKELFLEAEERRRQLEAGGQSGCSLKSSHQPTGQSGVLHASPGPSMGMGTGTGSSSEWRWVCQVCTEENVSNKVLLVDDPAKTTCSSTSSAGTSLSLKVEVGDAGGVGVNADVVCGWCGCLYGSSLLQAGGNGQGGSGSGSGSGSDGANKKQSETLQRIGPKNNNTRNLGGSGNVIKNGLVGGEVYCIDCDSPEFNGKQAKEKSIVDLIADDEIIDNISSSSRGKATRTEDRERSGSVVNTKGEELCRWTRLEARGCPCCIVVLSPADMSTENTSSGRVGGSADASRDAAKTGLNPNSAKDEAVIETERKSSTGGVDTLSAGNGETSLQSDQQAPVVKRKKAKIDPADVIVID